MIGHAPPRPSSAPSNEIETGILKRLKRNLPLSVYGEHLAPIHDVVVSILVLRYPETAGGAQYRESSRITVNYHHLLFL
jgi:hypothetical protein